MGILDMFTENNATLGDQDIASDMLKDSKFAVVSLAAAVGEISHPQLRQFFSQQLLSCVESHYRLSDLVTQKDWYHPHVTPAQQLSFDTRQAEGIRHSDRQ